MVAKKFWSLTLSCVSSLEEDLLTAQLFEAGASGVQEDLKFEQEDKKYLPTVEESSVKTLIAYFENHPPENLESEIAESFPGVKWDLKEEWNRDWLEEWKAGWKPFSLWEDFWVVPSWLVDSFDKSGKRVLNIDPGMAFGTGTHATTKIASQLIGEFLKEKESLSAIDVGTGSGILALLMEDLGVQKIYAYDNDSESYRVFHENLIKNRSQNIEWLEEWQNLNKQEIGLVVANIIDGVLLDLKGYFMKLSQVGMTYIWTGILKEREEDFLKEMSVGWNIQVQERVEKEEWVGFRVEVQA